MSKEAMTVESLKAEYPEVYNSVFSAGKADGEKTERESLKKFTEKFKDDAAFALAQFNDSKTMEEALTAYNEKLQLKITELSKVPPVIVTVVPAKTVDPAIKEFSDDAAKTPPVVDTNDSAALKKQFDADKKLQDEFGEFSTYESFVKAKTAGRVSIKGEK